MSDYWRPGFKKSWKERVEDFLDRNEEIPVQDTRDFIKFCTDKYISDYEAGEKDMQEIKEKVKELADQLEE